MDTRLKKNLNPVLTAIIAANVAMFLFLAIAGMTVSTDLTHNIGLSQSAGEALRRPWTIVTYSLAQANVLQLVFNMLWLYCFGRLLIMRCRSLHLFIIYVAGAIAGGVCFVAFSSLIGVNASGMLVGSSAAVIAVAVAVAVIMPDTELYLPLFGPTKIKWIVTVVIVLFCIGLSAPNAGGNLAHLGGVAAGATGALIIKRRESRPGIRTIKNEYGALVDKIRLSGYEALSAHEKRRFFELSSKKQA